MQDSLKVVYSYTVLMNSEEIEKKYKISSDYAILFSQEFFNHIKSFFKEKVFFNHQNNALEFCCKNEHEAHQVQSTVQALYNGLAGYLLNPWFINKIASSSITPLEDYVEIFKEHAVKIFNNV